MIKDNEAPPGPPLHRGFSLLLTIVAPPSPHVLHGGFFILITFVAPPLGELGHLGRRDSVRISENTKYSPKICPH